MQPRAPGRGDGVVAALRWAWTRPGGGARRQRRRPDCVTRRRLCHLGRVCWPRSPVVCCVVSWGRGRGRSDPACQTGEARRPLAGGAATPSDTRQAWHHMGRQLGSQGVAVDGRRPHTCPCHRGGGGCVRSTRINISRCCGVGSGPCGEGASRRACRRHPGRGQSARSAKNAAAKGPTRAVPASTVTLGTAHTAVVGVGRSRYRHRHGLSCRGGPG